MFYSVCVCVCALVSCVAIACVSYLSLCLWTRVWSDSNKYVCMYVIRLCHTQYGLTGEASDSAAFISKDHRKPLLCNGECKNRK